MGLIYIDACLLIYFAENHPRWGNAVSDALLHAQGPVCISPLVKCECLVGPMKRGDQLQQRTYNELFRRFVNLDIPEPVYLDAAALRARHGLKMSDALHLACAQHHRCEALWTNDNRLAQASLGLAAIILPAASF